MCRVPHDYAPAELIAAGELFGSPVWRGVVFGESARFTVCGGCTRGVSNGVNSTHLIS